MQKPIRSPGLLFYLSVPPAVISACTVVGQGALPAPQITRLEVPGKATFAFSTPGTPVYADPSPLASPIPSQTLLPSPAVTQPDPTPTLFPMSIQAERLKDYPGSEISIEETLDRGVNYS